MKLLLLGLLTGLDNLAVSSGLGVCSLSNKQRWLLMLAFGLCEGGMPLLGLALASEAWFTALPDLAPWCLFLAGALSLAGGWYYTNALKRQAAEGAPQSSAPWGWLLMLLPLGLSFDNLAAGAALAGSSLPSVGAALTIGVISTALAGLGLWGLGPLVGDSLATRLNLSRSLLASLWLWGYGLLSLVG